MLWIMEKAINSWSDRGVRTPLPSPWIRHCTAHYGQLIMHLGWLLCRHAFSQNLKSGRPGGMSPHKFVKLWCIFHFLPGLGIQRTRHLDTLLAKSLCKEVPLKNLNYSYCFGLAIIIIACQLANNFVKVCLSKQALTLSMAIEYFIN